jgi:Na+-driven multidrug efflux pump
VARATFLRLVVLSGLVGAAVLMNTGSGALAGATALTSGVFFEMAMVVWATRSQVQRRKREEETGSNSLRYRTIVRVATPMFVSAMVWTIMRPLTNSILGRLPDPELAQGAFGFVLPLVFVTCSPLWAIQNVAIVLPETRKDLLAAIRFAVYTATFFSVAIMILTWTPLRSILLRQIFDLTPEMMETVRPAIFLIAFEPFLLGSRTFTQGLLMKAKRTGSMLVFSPIKVIVFLAVGIIVTTRYPGTNGAVLGTALLLFGDLFDGCVYGFVARRLFRRGELVKLESP